VAILALNSKPQDKDHKLLVILEKATVPGGRSYVISFFRMQKMDEKIIDLSNLEC